MAWKLSNLPGGKDFPVEQATAAPGEQRNVERPIEVGDRVEIPDCGWFVCTAAGPDGYEFKRVDGE